MYNQWSLNVFYTGIDDPALEKDMTRLEEVIAEYKKAVAALDSKNPAASLKTVMVINEEMAVLNRRLAGYFSLRRSANSADSEGAKYTTKIQALTASTAKDSVVFQKFVGSIENLDAVLESDELLCQYKFYFSQIKKAVSHKIGDEAEDLFAQLNLSGGKAWGSMYDYLTATLEVEYDGTVTSLPAVRGLAENPDKNIRKAAFEAEIASYKKVKDPIAFALNSIKQQVNTEAKLRGYENPLAMTLEQSRLQKETLDAMLQAMRESLPKFREYLKHKAKLLGYEGGLPWYEILAPIGSSEGGSFTVPEAHAYLVEHFKTFAPDLAEMVDRAFNEEWIDFYPRAGKVGGAFCSNLPFANQSRILTNFAGTFGSVTTLAHELGHAYHGQQISDHRPLNTSYTMPVAETASNFNELIIVNDAIEKAEGGEKIALIEAQVQDSTQIIVDIYSRFLFEDEVFRRRADTFLYADDLEKIMLDAQKQAFGDGLGTDDNVVFTSFDLLVFTT